MVQKIKYLLKYFLWAIYGFVGSKVSLKRTQKVTVLITYFNPLRMRNLEFQIRNILKCDFVEKIIISNHNPDININDKTGIRDNRLIFINQPIKRGCGYRWLVANEYKFEYLIVIDDDFLISARQLAALFESLLKEPKTPHGLSGMRFFQNGNYEFCDKENVEVDFLCEIYAVTKSQLKRYVEIKESISGDMEIAGIVETAADFLVISQTGYSKPKIHEVGRLFRDETFKMDGVAVHKEHEFNQKLVKVLDAIQAQR
jgi:hypothetical protein